MQKTKSPMSNPDSMTYKEFTKKVEYFFPELYELANDIINSKISVKITLSDNYVINGFQCDNIIKEEIVDVDRDYMLFNTIIEKSKYNHNATPNRVCNSSYAMFVKFFYGYVTDNKDKHVFWFL